MLFVALQMKNCFLSLLSFSHAMSSILISWRTLQNLKLKSYLSQCEVSHETRGGSDKTNQVYWVISVAGVLGSCAVLSYSCSNLLACLRT